MDDSETSRPKSLGSYRYYGILGVERTATQNEIREAYKNIAKRLHPDKQNQQESSAFKELQNVYQVLSNENQRKIYDQYGEEGLDYASLRALNNKATTVEELGDKLRSLQHKTKKQWFDDNFNLKGNTTVGTSFGALKEILTGQRHVSEVEVFSSTQNYKFPLAPQHTMFLNTHVETNNGVGRHHLSINYVHERSHLLRFFSKVHFGYDTTQSEIGYRTAVDDLTSFKQSLFWDTKYHTLNLRVAMNRRLFFPIIAPVAVSETNPRSLHGNFHLFCGIYSGVRAGLRLVAKQFNVTLDSVIDPNTINVFLNLFLFNKHKDTRLTFGSSLHLPFDWQISSGINMDLTKETDFGIQNAVSLRNGVEINLRFSRWGQTLTIPINCDLLPNLSSALLSFAVSSIFVLFFQGFFIRPTRKRKLQAKQNKMNAERERRKIEAKEYLESMQWTLKNQVEAEKNRPGGGLIIRYAQYGNLAKHGLPKRENSTRWINDLPEEEDEEIIDVSSALQLLVNESRLQLTASPKHVLPGFWDPFPRNEKYLEIFYAHQGVNHRILIQDEESLFIPSRDHKLNKP